MKTHPTCALASAITLLLSCVMACALPARASAAVPAHTGAATPIDRAAVRKVLALASKAIAENRLVEPSADNAAEYYAQVLQLDITNQIAMDGLRELLPVTAGRLERMIEAGRAKEALRAISLLAIANPDSYILRELRSKAIGVSPADVVLMDLVRGLALSQ